MGDACGTVGERRAVMGEYVCGTMEENPGPDTGAGLAAVHTATCTAVGGYVRDDPGERSRPSTTDDELTTVRDVPDTTMRGCCLRIAQRL